MCKAVKDLQKGDKHMVNTMNSKNSNNAKLKAVVEIFSLLAVLSKLLATEVGSLIAESEVTDNE